MADDVATADKLFNDKQYDQVFDVLEKALQKAPDNKELLWRFVRAHFDKAELLPKEKRQPLLTEGLKLAEKGLAAHPNEAMFHKWVAILLSQLGDYKASKEKIADAYKIREHADKANALSPNDPTVLHLIGRWCLSVASLGWLERTAASALFGTPPSSTYEEALDYFTKAEKADSTNTFCRNMIFKGDTLVLMKKYTEAKDAFKKAADMPYKADLPREKEIHEEAASKYAKYQKY